MIYPPEPGPGDRILTWAREVQRVLRDFDRRLNSLPPAPRPRSEEISAVVETTHPFQVYPSPYTGTGTPPADQWGRVRVRRGTLNGCLPTNHAAEFLPADGQCLGLAAEFAVADPPAAGARVSYLNAVSLALLDLPEPSEDAPPLGTAYTTDGVPTEAFLPLAIFSVDTEAQSLSIDQLVTTSLLVSTVLSNSTCDGRSYTLMWSRV